MTFDGKSSLPFKAAGTSTTSEMANKKRREILVKSGPACWSEDYQAEIRVKPFGRYSTLRSLDGERFDYNKVESTFKLNILLTAGLAIVELRCFPVLSEVKRTAEKRAPNSPAVRTANKEREAQIQRVADDFEAAISETWNSKLKLQVNDPDCGTKLLPITYKIVWDKAAPHYRIRIYEEEIHEKVRNGEILVSINTSKQIFAHEFAHCLGIPDEYSHDKSANRIVNYRKPDGTFEEDIMALSTGYEANSTDPNGNIMCQKESTKVEVRHAWNIAIESQELLRKKLGKDIKCDILPV